jgi:uncharacterized GH25 family protein
MTGIVAGPDGSPVANVLVKAVRPMLLNLLPIVRPEPPPLASARTDAKGVFTFDVADRGVVDIQIRQDGFAPVDHQVFTDEPVGTISLRAVEMVEGKVTAAGQPVAGAMVTITGDESSVSTKTDARGIYRVGDPRGWGRTITVIHPDFALAQHARMALDFNLDKGKPVDGTVVDDAGKPVGGATVTLDDLQSTTSAADGKFHFPHAREYANALRASTATGYASAPVSSPVLQLKPAGQVMGTVRDEENQPLSGVIALVAGNGGSQFTTTGRSGSFSLDGVLRSSLRLLIAESALYSPESVTLDASAGDVKHDFVVHRKPAWEGRVVAADGAPVSGAAIIAIYSLSGSERELPTGIASGPDGRFRLRAWLDPRMNVRLVALINGLPPGHPDAPLAESRPVTITLPRGVVVSGTVVDKDKKPVANVRIRPLLASYTQESENGDVPMEPWVTTDQSGRFAARLPAGKVALKLVKRGYLPLNQTFEIAESMQPLNVSLNRIVGLSGVVVDTKDKPVAGVPITVGKTLVKSGVDGSFHLDEVEPGPAEIHFGTGNLDRHVTVPAFGLKLVVPALRIVRGKVIDAVTQQPIEKFEVVERSERTAAANGVFEVKVPESVWQVTIVASGYRSTDARLNATGEAITVALLPGPTLSGRVLDLKGLPAWNVRVAVSPVTSAGEESETKTEARGTFEFAGLTPARYDITAENKNGERAVAKDVDLSKVHEITLRLERPVAGTIVGSVNGAERGTTFVEVENAPWSKSATADASGHYRVENVPPGPVVVYAELNRPDGTSRISRRVVVEATANAETRADLTFAPTVPVRGNVTRRGVPLNVQISFRGEKANSAHSTADGTYEIALEPGEYDVVLSTGTSINPIPFSKHVVINEPTTLDLAVDPASVPVSVVDFDTGEPIGGASVVAVSSTDPLAKVQVTATDGTTSFELSRGEDFKLTATKRGYSNAVEEIKGEGRAVQFRIRGKAGAIVRLVDAHDGHALSGYVNARDIIGRNGFFSNQAEADGTVSLPLPPGDYQISASAEGYGSETVNVQVPAGDIRIPLPPGGNLALTSAKSCGAKVRLIQRNGEPYVRCWCNGIAVISVDCPRTLVDHVSPGSYVVEVSSKGGATKRIPVTIVEGQTVTVPID